MKILRNFFVICVCWAVVNTVQAQDFFKATADGDLDMVKRMLKENKALATTADKTGKTALHVAAGNNRLDIADCLLDHGADMNAANKYGMTPLFYAAEKGHAAVAKVLVKKGADVNTVSPFFGTALHRAVFMGHFEFTEFLLKKGASTRVQNSTGTVLHTAAIRDRLEQARLLINHGADVNSKNRENLTPLFYALSVGSNRKNDLAMLLIEKGAEVNAMNKEGVSVLMLAVKMGFADIVDTLIKRGADKKIQTPAVKQSLLHISAINGYGDVAGLLIHHGLEVNAKDKKGHSPLYYAAKYGHKTVAQRLLQAGAKKEKMEENYGDSRFLKKKLPVGEAYLWLLKGRGYVIKTRNQLFILDNEETGRKPDQPSVDNGYYSLSELKDLKVTALYSAYHALPQTMEFIHTFENDIKNIQYLHYKDDRWRGGSKSAYLKGREFFKREGLDILTIETHEKYGMGSLGYLIKSDGLTMFYPSFPTSKTEEFKKEIDFIAGHIKSCDLVFVMAMPGEGEACADYIIEKLKPKAVLPMGHKSLHKHFKSFMQKIAQKYPDLQISYPKYGGDRIHYKTGRLL
jgi:ankyrin repeat protein